MACRSLPDACGFRTERAGWIHPRLMVQLGLILIAPLTYFIFFFFSSRGRHTRCGRDWGSDVCSSDLQRTASTGLRSFNVIKHDNIEKSLPLMVILIVVALSWSDLAEVVPLFFQTETTQPMEGLKPMNALELEGRDIYIREGCHVCHTQMVRPFRAETERYGPYKVA